MPGFCVAIFCKAIPEFSVEIASLAQNVSSQ
jgi:hypothetical protein